MDFYRFSFWTQSSSTFLFSQINRWRGMLVKTTDDLKLDMIANILKEENADNDFERSGLKKSKIKN